MAKLYFRYGAMNSGKSTAVLQVAHNYEERGMNVVIIKSAIDSKGDDKIVSRLGKDRTVHLLAPPNLNFEETIKKLSPKPDCILIDEAQFLTKPQVDQLFNVAVSQGIPVICYGLRTDFRRKAFPGSLRLFELAHSLEELKTICRCGKKAMFNGRKQAGKFIFSGSQVAIDGKGKVTYEALCGNCYNEEKFKNHNSARATS